MTYIRRGPAIKNSKLEKTYLCHPPVLATTVQFLLKKNARVGTVGAVVSGSVSNDDGQISLKNTRARTHARARVP